MKKIYHSLVTFIFIFLAFSPYVYAYDPAASGISYSPTSDSMIYANTTNVDLNNITNAFNTIPSPLRELFRKEGVKLFYTTGVPKELRNFDGITVSPLISYYEGSNKIVKISRKPQVYIYSGNMTIIIPHEYGHVLDHIAGYATGRYIGDYGISSSAEWNTLFSSSASKLTSIDNATRENVPRGREEAFAEAFRLYCTNPTALQNACPEVYNFVAAQINKYAGGGGSTEVTKKTFDAQAYAEMYPDVKAALGTDKDALWNHYVNYGKKEGRTAPRVGQ